MALKGNVYTKTTWDYQERPVASSKLNTWDDRIEAALEAAFFLLNHAWGGGEGVLRGVTGHDLAVQAKSPPAMSVLVQPGWAFIDSAPYKLAAALSTPELAAPAVEPRIDLVQAVLDTWGIQVKQGQEAANPSAPSPDTGCLALGEIYLRPGMTSVLDADDGVNGYLTDARTFL